jgi:NAD+--dinitrogen-reductase ADP-D-ribosyltransferase
MPRLDDAQGGPAEPALEPARWYGSGMVGVAPAVLAGTSFNGRPQPLHVAGVRATHAPLFNALQKTNSANEARALFGHYMQEVFILGRTAPQADPGQGTRRWRTSYLKLLQGWGLDANGAAGAVLKGWAESRFGLLPAFHKVPLGRFPSAAWVSYLQDKGASRYHNHQILEQLDLLFEFCQWMLAHHQLLGPGPLSTLWRGSNRIEEQVVAGSLLARRCTVRLNNVVSFSTTREQAGCFGDWLLCVRVPLCKLLLVPGLLNTSSLQGEAEVLAIGGLYEAEASYA